jgi:hypothetical protein
VEVKLVYVEGCPNAEVARERITEAARHAGVAVDVRRQVVVTHAQAAAAGMPGSPTVLVAGADVTSAGDGPASLSCRLYAGGGGNEGAPDVESIVIALTRAAQGPVGADDC